MEPRPTPGEIAARAREIRLSWTTAERLSRRVSVVGLATDESDRQFQKQLEAERSAKCVSRRKDCLVQDVADDYALVERYPVQS